MTILCILLFSIYDWSRFKRLLENLKKINYARIQYKPYMFYDNILLVILTVVRYAKYP